LLLAAALCLPSSAQAVTISDGDFFSVVVNDQSVTFRPNVVPSVCSTSTWSYRVYYDWQYDGSWAANTTYFFNTAKYGATFIQTSTGMQVGSITLALDPRYQVYYLLLNATGTDGNVYQSQHLIVNNRAEVVLANDEPTPVRIQEIGLASEASTLSPDILPTSLDASVSVDGTLPVSVASFLGEDDGPLLWTMLGGLVGIASFVLVKRGAERV